MCAGDFKSLTLPSHAALLSRAGENPHIAAFGAELFGRPIGLALGRFFPSTGRAVLLSLFVQPECRQSGLGTVLLAELERSLAAKGATEVDSTYVHGKPSTPAFERVLQKRGWDPPRFENVLYKIDGDALYESTLLARMGNLPDGFSFFPWAELTDDDRHSIAERDAAERWVFPEVDPFDRRPFDPLTSVGLRHDGEVIGWLVTRPHSRTTIELSPVWVQPSYARLGHCIALLALIRELFRLDRMHTGYKFALWKPDRPEMVLFGERWMRPFAVSTNEIRSARKQLRDAGAAIT